MVAKIEINRPQLPEAESEKKETPPRVPDTPRLEEIVRDANGNTVLKLPPTGLEFTLKENKILAEYGAGTKKNPDATTEYAQTLLREVQDKTMTIDGIFRSKTRDCISAYQERKKNLEKTGKLDTNTLRELEKDYLKKTQERLANYNPRAETTVAERGAGLGGKQADPTTWDIQTMLKTVLGKYIKADGKFGGGTENVVKEFKRKIQKEKGIELPQGGKVDGHTYDLLAKAYTEHPKAVSLDSPELLAAKKKAIEGPFSVGTVHQIDRMTAYWPAPRSEIARLPPKKRSWIARLIGRKNSVDSIYRFQGGPKAKNGMQIWGKHTYEKYIAAPNKTKFMLIATGNSVPDGVYFKFEGTNDPVLSKLVLRSGDTGSYFTNSGIRKIDIPVQQPETMASTHFNKSRTRGHDVKLVVIPESEALKIAASFQRDVDAGLIAAR